MGKKLVVLLLLAGSYTSLAQEKVKMAAFSDLLAYERNEVMDCVRVEITPMENSFTPKFCKPYPIGTNYYYSHLAKNVAILSDGNTLLLNIKQFRILNGFVRLNANRKYSCFRSRMAKPDGNSGSDASLMFGLVGYAAHELKKEAEARQSVAYVFVKGSARLHVLNPGTVERFLEPYPDIFYAYKTDPTKMEFETMATYLEILEDMEGMEAK